ncbi:MAG: bifunctional 5,10-methylenetetrahydrofolate dehydrogenase/5,10-methenyltetrahydrofolate cyclohydrolase [Sediminibacterium sp.]|nr:bifunctional 5,10-methylenetetrahydrofolate dehydrogenase/5,10-methenyltetrahydrofolate cyclohydrolase [Sediminibacterium sp.]
MLILDGKFASNEIKKQLKQEVDCIIKNNLRQPHLVAIIIGKNPASTFYVQSKIKNCVEVGIKSTLYNFDDITEEALLSLINKLNFEEDVDGILVQLPLPKHINENKIIEAIDVNKDVDGFHPTNMGKLVLGIAGFIPATPLGILLLLDFYKIDIEGKNVAVIGRSNIVGKPMAILLSNKGKNRNCTVTLCHSKTANIEEITRQADVVIAAIGIPNFITKNFIKPNAILIDVGINRVNNNSAKGYEIVGDIDFKNVSTICSAITPVPGGVGLMTIVALLTNTIHSFKLRNNV